MSDTYKCDQCNDAFDYQNHLLKHISEKHKTRDVECPVCGRMFASKNGMNCHKGKAHDNPWQDKDVLKSLHLEKGYNSPKIAEKLGCSESAVERYLREYNLQQYSRGDRRNKSPPQHQFIDKKRRVGSIYEVVATQVDYELKTVSVHQLIAIANGADPYKVFSDGDYHVHHKNGHGLDNRPGNLEFLSAKEHKHKHMDWLKYLVPWGCRGS